MSPRRTDHTRRPLFRLGQLVATPGAIEVMERLGIDPLGLVARHVTGDWGDLDADDCAVNETALRMGGRIFSAYGAQGDDGCLWVITDGVVGPVDEDADPDAVVSGMAWERLTTTILRPEDY